MSAKHQAVGSLNAADLTEAYVDFNKGGVTVATLAKHLR